jgi:hypothetical protein
MRMADDRFSRYADLGDLRASESCWLAATKCIAGGLERFSP